MNRIFWGGVTLFVVIGSILGVLEAAGCDPAPAEPTGVELDVDIDRARTRAPLKTQKPAPAPKPPKAVKR